MARRAHIDMPSHKSRLVALVLCIAGGYLGLHYFYVRRYWRGAVNLFLLLGLVIASRVFGLRYFYIFRDPTVDALVHWREIVAVACAAILGVTWILDIVFLLKGRFRDYRRCVLR